MFEKLPAVRVNNRENSSGERVIADVRELRGKETLNDASGRFPSYLHIFDNFFGPLTAESYWGAAPLLASCCGGFPTAQSHVAFL
jgi:hypothetical protein